MRPLRTALVGNVAQNAFVLAKFLRRYEEVEADSYDSGIGQAMWVPQWEDGEFDPTAVQAGGAVSCWRGIPPPPDRPLPAGLHRPEWARILGEDGGPAWFADEDAQRSWWGFARVTDGRACRPVLQTFAGPTALPAAYEAPAPAADFPADLPDDTPTIGVLRVRNWQTIRSLQAQYDVVLLLGASAQAGAYLPRGSYVTFEHATMRHVEQRTTVERQLLAAAYRRAAWNVLTNADCQRSAQALGLERYSFIPHPVDTDTFAPAATARSAQLRNDLLTWSGARVLFLAPARQSEDPYSGEKDNDVVLRAYQRYVAEAEPQGAPRAHLLLALWGSRVEQAVARCRELGITGRVSWYPLLPKRQLADLYRACDVVLDQFSAAVGSYGTITVEALATARPVITWVDAARHAWCRDVLPVPPVCRAQTDAEAYAHLVRLARDPAEALAVGDAARTWVDRWHSPQRVARLHAELYRRLLAEGLGTSIPGAHAAHAAQLQEEAIVVWSSDPRLKPGACA